VNHSLTTRADLNRRLRQTFLAGAEERSRRDHGRGLSDDELRRVLTHYPGDMPADNGDVTTLSPTPLFHGTPILVDFDPGIRNARVVLAGLHGLVRRMEDRHASEDELIAAVLEIIAQYRLAGRLAARTREAIEFAVTRT